MLFEESRLTGSAINWPGGKPRDRVAVPDHAVPLLEAAKLRAQVGVNVYEIINERGDALQLPFGCTHEEWAAAIAQLTSG